MWGAIAGDVIGSVDEGRPVKDTDFPLFQNASYFADDTMLTVATAVFPARTGDTKETIRIHRLADPGRVRILLACLAASVALTNPAAAPCGFQWALFAAGRPPFNRPMLYTIL